MHPYTAGQLAVGLQRRRGVINDNYFRRSRQPPETNGVVERWNRTLKEQAVYGRVFRNLADVRAAVAEFVERYN